jgi:hypothetical protein
LLGLGEHLASGASVDPEEAQKWSTSEEGKQFTRQSSEAWALASVGSGTDAAAAAAAAARTTAAYTGESPPDGAV